MLDAVINCTILWYVQHFTTEQRESGQKYRHVAFKDLHGPLHSSPPHFLSSMVLVRHSHLMFQPSLSAPLTHTWAPILGYMVSVRSPSAWPSQSRWATVTFCCSPVSQFLSPTLEHPSYIMSACSAVLLDVIHFLFCCFDYYYYFIIFYFSSWYSAVVANSKFPWLRGSFSAGPWQFLYRLLLGPWC